MSSPNKFVFIIFQKTFYHTCIHAELKGYMYVINLCYKYFSLMVKPSETYPSRLYIKCTGILFEYSTC